MSAVQVNDFDATTYGDIWMGDDGFKSTKLFTNDIILHKREQRYLKLIAITYVNMKNEALMHE